MKGFPYFTRYYCHSLNDALKNITIQFIETIKDNKGWNQSCMRGAVSS